MDHLNHTPHVATQACTGHLSRTTATIPEGVAVLRDKGVAPQVVAPLAIAAAMTHHPEVVGRDGNLAVPAGTAITAAANAHRVPLVGVREAHPTFNTTMVALPSPQTAMTPTQGTSTSSSK